MEEYKNTIQTHGKKKLRKMQEKIRDFKRSKTFKRPITSWNYYDVNGIHICKLEIKEGAKRSMWKGWKNIVIEDKPMGRKNLESCKKWTDTLRDQLRHKIIMI